MPGMNGHELAQQLLKLRPSVKVVYMSGYTENAIGRGTQLEQLLRQFVPVHAGHDDVGEQQVNRGQDGPAPPAARSPVHCSQDHVALVQKILVGKTKKIWFIFDDKNGLFAMLGFARRPQPLLERWIR